MNHDWFWIAVTVILDLSVASGYVLIALHWRRNAQPLPASPAKSALRDMKQIFLFCGLGGYVFIPISMVWPAWRLYNVFLLVLAYYTWRYVSRVRDLDVIYGELDRTDKLARDLEESRTDAARKSSFLNAVGHDLRTPLNGLLLQAELADLSLAGQDMDGCRDALAEIKSCARTSAVLLNKFLEIGRLDWSPESLRWTRFSLGEVLQNAVDKYRKQAEEKGLRISHASQGNPTICSDRGRLERILYNLLENAVAYTATGEIVLLGEAEGHGVVIRVRDSGVGIARDKLELIFDDFYQVHNRERDSAKGLGVGLPIARRIARQLGGTLNVASEPGRGSEFSIHLPDALTADPDRGRASGDASPGQPPQAAPPAR
jgi:signal transduction histidine kinase